jgi:hypothetical protein
LRIARSEFRGAPKKAQGIGPALLRPSAGAFECGKQTCGLRIVARRGAFDQRETFAWFEWRIAPDQKASAQIAHGRNIASRHS